ncbi:hypothetical protein GCM10011579_071200 [Streptomyces albiflavescens]|uniref:Uncharacterized protein n=1 Tax=Streptomyces albiflavescens TaxID=1623582 RepID=A0A917YBJ8_9ACTN|nr:hypothetical protein [Streptomyces albiflavescens]GGN82950.1 hypothetical protein GCM10011579_071200 [Streptomyces albiflavescens]
MTASTSTSTSTSTGTRIRTRMSARKRIAVGLATTALLGGGLALAPAATAAAKAPTADSCTNNWSISSGEGYANGKWCNYDRKVTGTVHDTKSDGRCPFVRGLLRGGGYVDSDWAGPKGDSSPVRLYAPSGKSFYQLQMKYINC